MICNYFNLFAGFEQLHFIKNFVVRLFLVVSYARQKLIEKYYLVSFCIIWIPNYQKINCFLLTLIYLFYSFKIRSNFEYLHYFLNTGRYLVLKVNFYFVFNYFLNHLNFVKLIYLSKAMILKNFHFFSQYSCANLCFILTSIG